MILIADSGSTKTDWCVVENGQLIRQIFTKGTNPFFQSEEEISNEIATALLPRLTTDALDAVYFYGAGCGFPDKIAMVHRAITKHLRVKGEVEVNTDMLAAARGLCQHDAGIACIMGTGSNSCYYDGKQIVSNVSPLGFILGDEGSGAVLGKLLVGDILKTRCPRTEGEVPHAVQPDTRRYHRPCIPQAVPQPFSGKPLSIPCTEPGRTLHTHAGIGQLQGIPQT